MEPFKKFFRDKDKKAVRLLMIGLAAGLVLLTVSRFYNQPAAAVGVTPEPPAARQEKTGLSDLESGMEEILALVEGAGAVEVLINYSQGTETVVARNSTSDVHVTDELDAAGGTREQNQTKIQDSVMTLRGQEGGEEPLVLYEIPPKIEGVIIVAEGGGDMFVKDALIRAASGFLGVDLHKVTVLKMAAKQRNNN
jgi:stage III sporulation protein AG